MAAEMPAHGKSASHSNTKNRARTLFDEFRASTPSRAASILPWAEQSAETLLVMGVFAGYAEFLTNEFVIQEGDRNEGCFLAVGTILDYLGAILNLAADRFKHIRDDAAKLFLTCLDKNANTEPAIWLRKMKAQIVRVCFERVMRSGEEIDKSCVPIYLGRGGGPEAEKWHSLYALCGGRPHGSAVADGPLRRG